MTEQAEGNKDGVESRSTALERGLAGALGDLAVNSSMTIVVGVSGGADSMALLDSLNRWIGSSGGKGRIVVAHLNHQLRGAEADLDEALVRRVAGSLGLSCEVEYRNVAEVARSCRLNLEAAARECRYQFFGRVAQVWQTKVDPSAECVVCTAHTSDDQAETVLMRLLRGSGTTGLAGIHQQRHLTDGVRLIRPLLGVRRSEVIEHCRQRQVDFRYDQSNHSIDYLRNRVRHELIPILQSYNPAISDLLVRTAELLREDDTCLQTLAREHRQAAMVDGGLAVGLLNQLPVALRRRVLRDWIAAQRGGLQSLTVAHLEALERLLAPNRSGRRIELPGRLVVVRSFDTLQFQQIPRPHPDETRLTPGQSVVFDEFQILLHPGSTPPPSPATTRGWIVAMPKIAGTTELLVRTRRPGDSIRPAASRHRIKLKTLMIRHKIPVSKRDTWPVIVSAADDRLVWVPGIAVSAEFALGAEVAFNAGLDNSVVPDSTSSKAGSQPLFWLLAAARVKLASENR